MARTEGIPAEMRIPVAITLPRLPLRVCYGRPIEARDCENMFIDFSDAGKYQLLQQIGRGRYSLVFDSVEMDTHREVVIKKLVTRNERKVKRELIYLDLLRDGPNIINSLHVIKMDVQGEKFTYGIVFEKVNNRDHRILYREFDEYQVRYYLYQLLRALEYAHMKGVMHRDVKPGNIVIDHPNKILRLIDWGFGALYFPGQPYYCGACTLPYRAPELLLGYRQYHYAVDMWSFGCLAAGMIFRKDVFFESVDERTQLQAIGQLLGREKLDAYLAKYRIRSSTHHFVEQSAEGISLKSFLRPDNRAFATCSAMSLLRQILVYDHQERLTATEAKKHPYFLMLKQGHVHFKKQSAPNQCANAEGPQEEAGAEPPEQELEVEQDPQEEDRNVEMEDADADVEDEDVDVLPDLDPDFADVIMDDLMRAGPSGENRRSSPNEAGPSQRGESAASMEYNAAEDSFFDGEDNTYDYMESADEDDEDRGCALSDDCVFDDVDIEVVEEVQIEEGESVDIEVVEEVQIEEGESVEIHEDLPGNEDPPKNEDLPQDEDDDEDL